jgi:glycosyltransferase 2 family protein
VSLPRLRRLAGNIFGSPWVRLIGSVVAVAIFVHGVDLPKALRLYGHLAPGWVLLAVGLAALSVVASVAEWGVLLRGSGNHLDWAFLGSWYLKGLFVNQVTPAGVGSDAMRALQVGKVTGHGPMVASLVASRMAGTLAMSWWALAAAVISRDRLHIPAVTGFVIFAAAMILAWVLALVAELVRRRIPRHRPIPHAIGLFVRPFTRSFESYRGHPKTVGRSIAAGIVAWGLNLFSMAAFAMALHSSVSWSVFALVLPVALLVTFIPISANGIGVREGLLVLLLVQAHVAVSTATALSLFVDLQLLPFAVMGGAVYVLEHLARRSPLGVDHLGVGAPPDEQRPHHGDDQHDEQEQLHPVDDEARAAGQRPGVGGEDEDPPHPGDERDDEEGLGGELVVAQRDPHGVEQLHDHEHEKGLVEDVDDERVDVVDVEGGDQVAARAEEKQRAAADQEDGDDRVDDVLDRRHGGEDAPAARAGGRGSHG